jgi:anti-anti-sigma factor
MPKEVQVVHLSGKLDSSTSRTVETQVLGVIDGGSRKLLLDCSDLAFITSAGLRVILAIAKRMNAERGQLALCSMSVPVAEIFEVTGYNTVIEVFPDQEAARTKLLAR